MIFEGTQYSVKLKFIKPEYETITQIESVSLYSTINRWYPLISITLFIPPTVYREIIRFNSVPFFLEIKQIMETNDETHASKIKEFKFKLILLNYNYIFPHKDIKDDNKSNDYNAITKIELICAPYSSYILTNEIITADVYRNKTLKQILESVISDVKIKPDFDNQFQFEEVFIPTMSRQKLVDFLNYYYGFYKGEYVAYIGFDDEKQQVLDFEKGKVFISKINTIKKDGSDVLRIHYTNNRSGNDNIPKDNQRDPANNFYLSVGDLHANLNLINITQVEGFKQRYVFKPLDLLHDTRYNDYSKKEKSETNIDKTNSFMLSKQSTEIESFKVFEDMYKNGYKNYVGRTNYKFLDEDIFNECIIAKNDAIMNNDNFYLYFPISKGIMLNHFLVPGRTVIVSSEPENIQITGSYYLHTSIVSIYRNSHTNYLASAQIKVGRANINHDEPR